MKVESLNIPDKKNCIIVFKETKERWKNLQKGLNYRWEFFELIFWIFQKIGFIFHHLHFQKKKKWCVQKFGKPAELIPCIKVLNQS